MLQFHEILNMHSLLKKCLLFSDFSNITIAVSNNSIIDSILSENSLDDLKICAKLERPITPNKQIINCDTYYEGRYLLVIKKTQGFLSLNEIVPNLLGN